MWFLYDQSSIIYISKLNGGWFGKIMDCLFGDQGSYLDPNNHMLFIFMCILYTYKNKNMTIKIFKI